MDIFYFTMLWLFFVPAVCLRRLWGCQVWTQYSRDTLLQINFASLAQTPDLVLQLPGFILRNFYGSRGVKGDKKRKQGKRVGRAGRYIEYRRYIEICSTCDVVNNYDTNIEYKLEFGFSRPLQLTAPPIQKTLLAECCCCSLHVLIVC